MNDIPNITTGAELEFICVRPNSFSIAEYPDLDPFDGFGPVIYRKLLERGIRATGWENDDVINDNALTHSRWRVETDELELSDKETELLSDDWTLESVELSSRKLHFFLDEWREEVAAVLKVLRDVESYGCRFLTNKSTGFHVHVGHNTERIPLRVAKNVFQLATAFERCFDELHTAPRITVPKDLVYGYCYYPLSFFHSVGKEITEEHLSLNSSPLLDRLANIETVRTYEELGAFFNRRLPVACCSTTGHNSSYNFDNLYANLDHGRSEEQVTGTIEFRQHTGTLDFVEIVAWVTLVVQLVRYANVAPVSDILDLLLRGIDTQFRLEDLFLALDINEDVMDHYLNHGPVIGVLGADSNSLSGPTTNASVDSLIEQNDDECEERASRDAVHAAIHQKYVSGLYGLDPNRSVVTLPPSLAGRELKKALVTTHMAMLDNATEQGVSRARWQVLKHFSQLYNRGTVDFTPGM